MVELAMFVTGIVLMGIFAVLIIGSCVAKSMEKK